MRPRRSERWNHNTHYHRMVLDAVPPGATSALDVGCGEGMLARELRARVPNVTGIDLDEPSIALAREAGGGVEYVLGDALTHPMGPFDLVVSVATLHHLDARAGLRRFADLTAPGGRLVVVGLAADDGLRDAPREPRGSRCQHRGGAATRVLGALGPAGLAAAGDLRRDADDRARRAARCPVPTAPVLALVAGVGPAVDLSQADGPPSVRSADVSGWCTQTHSADGRTVTSSTVPGSITSPSS